MDQLRDIIKAKRVELDVNKSEMGRRLGISSQLYGQYERGERSPGATFFVRWKEAFGEDLTEHIEATVSLSDVQHKTGQYNRQQVKLGDRKRKIPFYDAPASAGMSETEMTPIHAPSGTIDVGDLLHDSEAAIRIYGNSMLPNYPPGCVVGLSKTTNSFIQPGEVYVIETADQRLLKRLFYKDDIPGDSITCYSDNTMKFEGGSRHGKEAYPPFDITKKEIKRLYIVTGVIKRNANSIIINR